MIYWHVEEYNPVRFKCFWTLECIPITLECSNIYIARVDYVVVGRFGEVMKIQKTGNKELEEYATRGPFASIFGGPIARLFDQALIVGNAEQTISILAESTNLSYKTTKVALEKLRKMGFALPTRRIGNAQAYKFLVENEMHELLSCGENFQRKREDI